MCFFVVGTFALIDPNTDLYTPLMYAATGMAVALWFSIMLLPLVQVCIMCEVGGGGAVQTDAVLLYKTGTLPLFVGINTVNNFKKFHVCLLNFIYNIVQYMYLYSIYCVVEFKLTEINSIDFIKKVQRLCRGNSFSLT